MNKNAMAIIAVLAVSCMVLACIPSNEADAADGTDLSTALIADEKGNFTVSGGDYILNEGFTATGNITFIGTCTLDLNGNTLNLDDEWMYVGNKTDECSLTISDSQSDGTITGTNGQMIWIYGNATVVLESGTLSGTGYGTVRTDSSSTFTMKGGSVTNTSNPAIQIVGGTINIEAGTVSNNESAKYSAVDISTNNVTIGVTGQPGPTISSIDPNEKTVIINSGTIGTAGGEFGAGSTFNCTFLTDITNYLPEGLFCSGSDGNYKVVELTKENAAAQIGDTLYGSLAVAASAMTNGQTLDVLKDYSGPTSISFNVYKGTVNLNGHSITNTSTSKYAYALDISPMSNVNYVSGGFTINGIGTLTASIPVYVSSGNSTFDLHLIIGDGVTLTPTGSNGSLRIESTAFVDGNDYYRSLISMGGFEIVDSNNNSYIYGSASKLSEVDADRSTVLLHDYTGSVGVAAEGTFYIDLGGNTLKGSIDINSDNCSLTVRNGYVNGDLSIGVGYDNCTLTIEDVDITSNTDFGIVTNGTSINNNITVNGGSITADNGWGIYHPSTGTVRINGTTITGITGVEIRKGSLYIEGNTKITATGDYEVKENNSGTTTEGAAVAIAPYESDAESTLTASIFGGTFVGAVAVAQNNPNETANVIIEMGISGGSFTSNDKTKASIVATNAKGFISGGSFNTQLSGELLDPDYTLVETGDGYFPSYEPSEDYVAPVTTISSDGVKISYQSLEEAFASVAGGQTIRLGEAAEVDQTLYNTRNDVTFDLNGFTITLNNYTIFNTGSLTISNGKIISTNAAAVNLGQMILSGMNVSGGIVSADQTFIDTLGSSNSTSLTVRNSTISAPLYCFMLLNSDLFVDSGSFTTSASDGYGFGIVAFGSSNVVINGGSFSYATSLLEPDYVIGSEGLNLPLTGSIIVYAGTFNGQPASELASELADLTLQSQSGGMATYVSEYGYTVMIPVDSAAIPGYEEDDELPPFIPQQSTGKDDTTLYIACCAAAAVVAILTIVIVMQERRR